MTSNEKSWFLKGSGGYLPPDKLEILFQSFCLVMLLSVAAFICIRSYQDFSSSEITANEMIIVWGRVVLSIMIILAVVL